MPEMEAAVEAALRPVYRERAQFAAFLAHMFRHTSAMSRNDENWPGWWVLYVHTIEGQLSWHIHPDDMDLFAGIRKAAPEDPWAQWDEHSTEEKYARLGRLAGRLLTREDDER